MTLLYLKITIILEFIFCSCTLGVTTMKLPLADYMNSDHYQGFILTLNQVLGIILDLYHGEEGTNTLVCHVPSRKASLKQSYVADKLWLGGRSHVVYAGGTTS